MGCFSRRLFWSAAALRLHDFDGYIAKLVEPMRPAIAVTTIRNGNTAISIDSEMWLAIAQPSSRLKR